MIAKPIVPLVEYEDAAPEVRAVYDDIMRTRGTDWVNNFWKVLAHDAALLRRTWEDIRQVMAPGALDPLTKELIYIAVSATNGCEYCTYSHTASAREGRERGAAHGSCSPWSAWPTRPTGSPTACARRSIRNSCRRAEHTSKNRVLRAGRTRFCQSYAWLFATGNAAKITAPVRET